MLLVEDTSESLQELAEELKCQLPQLQYEVIENALHFRDNPSEFPVLY